MAPIRHLLMPLSFLFFTTLLPNSSSLSDADFRKWVSYNMKEYQRTAGAGAGALGLKAQPAASWRPNSSGDRRSLDPRLKAAEENRVRITVSQDGGGDYGSIKDAIDSIPKNNSRRFVVEIGPGVYREKIPIPQSKPFVTLHGDAANPPVITGNDTASVAGEDGAPLHTFHSATVAVNADYFIAANIQFENTAPYPETGSAGGQAVALRMSGNKAAFYNCSFSGTQDTLYDHKGLHYFHNCFIQGAVDFIFGYGRSLYENCTLNSVANRVAAVTAQKRTNATLSSGFSFTRSSITGTGKVYLGRAWGDFSRVVFSYTFMDNLVLPQGWNDWGIPQRQSSVFYGEYKCSGPGADYRGRVQWARQLSDKEAKPFLGTYYVDGDKWLLPP